MSINWSSLFLGAALGVPFGFATQYVYDHFFPTTALPIGAQQLNAPVSNFSGYGLQGGAGRHGYVEVWYTEGTDTSSYTCGYEITHPQLFEKIEFADGCRRLDFSFVEPEDIPEEYIEVDVDPVFQIWVESAKGNRWTGSTGLYFYYLSR